MFGLFGASMRRPVASSRREGTGPACAASARVAPRRSESGRRIARARGRQRPATRPNFKLSLAYNQPYALRGFRKSRRNLLSSYQIAKPTASIRPEATMSTKRIGRKSSGVIEILAVSSSFTSTYSTTPLPTRSCQLNHSKNSWCHGMFHLVRT